MGETHEFVTRRIPLVPVEPERLDSILDELLAMDAVSAASLDSRGRLRIRYDAAAVGLREIEQRLDQAGLTQPKGLAWRCKAAWYRYLDDNIRANAASRGSACCNRPPKP